MPSPPGTARLAVVIVNYQSYDELRTCLNSLGGTCATIPVVVVDHASDETSADELSRCFPAVRLLREPGNAGFAAGVNAGARETEAPFLLLLNPDCTVESDTCCRLVEWMEQHPDVAVAGPRIRNADGTVQPSARRFPDLTTAIAGRSSWLTRIFPANSLSKRNLPARDGSLASAVEVDWVSGACMIVRRQAFEAVGGMDEGFFLYWEDADFCRRLKHAGWRTMYCPAVGATHIGGRSSRHAADASLEAFHNSAFRLFRKHTSLPGQLATPIVFLGLQARLAFMKRLVRWRGH